MLVALITFNLHYHDYQLVVCDYSCGAYLLTYTYVGGRYNCVFSIPLDLMVLHRFEDSFRMLTSLMNIARNRSK